MPPVKAGRSFIRGCNLAPKRVPCWPDVAHRRPGDALYVYYGARRALLFYAPQAGFEPTETTLGGCHRGDPRSYLRELDVFRGRPRVWVLFAANNWPLLEQPTISAYLDLIGKRRATFAAPGAALASTT